MSVQAAPPLSLSNLLRPEVRANPYPFYAQLRSQDPVHWDEAMGVWVLTRLLRRFPQLQRTTDTLEWQEHPTFRGLKSLPVAF